MILEVLATGSGVTIQDGGRIGWQRYGVPTGGAMDKRSLEIANRLLNNRIHAPALECAQQGARFRILKDTWLGLSGGDFCSRLRSGTARPFVSGDVIEFDRAGRGVYAYLSIIGGFTADTYFGSASTDERIGLGQAIKRGTVLDAQREEPPFSTDRVAQRTLSGADFQPPIPGKTSTQHFEVFRGPQFDHFDVSSQRAFEAEIWKTSSQSDRTGFRLEGVMLSVPPMIPSEPVLPGSFQVPGNGRPIVTMPDGPTVGGYAKIAVLRECDLPRFAQSSPGTELKFSWID